MAECNAYCATPLPEFSINECNATVAGGGKNAILFDCQAEAVENSDFTAATILTDIAAGHATVVRDTIIEAADASPNAASSAAVAGEEPLVKNYTQTIVISDPNVSVANDQAYQDLDATTGRKVAAVIVTTADDHSELYLAISAFQMTVTKPLTGSIDDFIKYSATLTGKMKHKSDMITTPAGVY